MMLGWMEGEFFWRHMLTSALEVEQDPVLQKATELASKDLVQTAQDFGTVQFEQDLALRPNNKAVLLIDSITSKTRVILDQVSWAGDPLKKQDPMDETSVLVPIGKRLDLLYGL